MLSKNKGKFIRSLQLQKYRQKYHKIVVEGSKILNELLDERPESIITVCGLTEWYEKFADSVPESCDLILISEHEMSQLTSFKSPPPVLAVVEPDLAPAMAHDLISGMCLYLDSIRDPGNLGTIFRIADWFGVQSIFLSPDTVDPFNPKVIQSSMASIFRVKWTYAQIKELVVHDDMTVLAATLDGTPMNNFDTLKSGLLVLGNESRGISESVLMLATDCITIPGNHTLGAESLNVAVAAGILCAHFRSRDTEK